MCPVRCVESPAQADLLEHFRTSWDHCAEVERVAQAGQQLPAKIVERGFLMPPRSRTPNGDNISRSFLLDYTLEPLNVLSLAG